MYFLSTPVLGLVLPLSVGLKLVHGLGEIYSLKYPHMKWAIILVYCIHMVLIAKVMPRRPIVYH